MNHARSLAVVAVAVAALAAPGGAQVAWRPVEALVPRSGAGMAFVPGMPGVLFGGLASGNQLLRETWEWRGNRWQLRPTPTAPSAGGSCRMVEDLGRGRAVAVFETIAGPIETWEWDGTDWGQVATAPPPRRFGCALAYDVARRRTVLFGGDDGVAPLGDLWEFDGVAWTSIAASPAPPPRSGHALAYDWVRQRTVLFGGGDLNGVIDGVWEWDGAQWHGPISAPGPGGRLAPAMGFEPRLGRIVLFGGCAGSGPSDDTWAWDGAAWTPIATATRPPRRCGGVLAYDSSAQRLRLFGGFDREPLGDTWELDAQGWHRIADEAAPAPRSAAAFAAAPGGGLAMHGGVGRTSPHGDLWLLRGDLWQPYVVAGARPLPRSEHAMVLDTARDRLVLFGGTPGTLALADTWEFDGVAWRDATPATSPPMRHLHAMAFDSSRRRTVLFGGASLGRALADTWEWDGSAWTSVSTTTAPAPRARHAMTFDAARGEVLLFGGTTAAGPDFETWTYDGSQWRQRFPVTVPRLAVGRASLAWDAARERAVLWGDGGDAWEWDGVDWTQRVPLASPTARARPQLAWDAEGEAVVAYSDDVSGDGTAWRYAPLDPAVAQRFGHGCGPAPAPEVRTRGDRRPWLGDTVVVEVAPLPAAATFAAVLLGDSDRTWNGVPLPLDLGILGMAGCELAVAPRLAVPVPAVGGAVALTWQVPSRRWAIGAGTFVQAAVPAPGANALGAVTSSSLRLVVGSR